VRFSIGDLILVVPLIYSVLSFVAIISLWGAFPLDSFGTFGLGEYFNSLAWDIGKSGVIRFGLSLFWIFITLL
jgi:hypothetical protein